MSYIYPFAVPMLENAGAYVLLPRERDINRNEVIVDNDVNDSGLLFSQPYYKEMTGSSKWVTGTEDGFIYDLPDFRDTENPFENGTYRQTTTVTSGSPSVAAWYADIPEDGEYAVYVSYKSLPNSTSDARYTVNYSGGTKEFVVNQTMGGSTWIYLGTFPLEAGYSDSEPVVTLSNLSKTPDKIVTADAVKIGGGMGNIARSPKRSDIYFDPSTPEEGLVSNTLIDDEDDDEEEEDEDDETSIDETSQFDNDTNNKANSTPAIPKTSPTFKTSGMPRFLEGARYWLQWAGMPEYIYSPYHGTDDYKDDYTSRGHWVNYLAGGSRVLPNQEGLNIPVDVAMALHSDAGKRADDSFVGTLGIYYTNGGDKYTDGTPRANSRTLTDMLMRQITGDIRQTWEPNWTRRSMWDKSYVEARVPEVPTTLIELLSHQNFADMKYALDPAFRFTVSRSIYKALGRFVAERKDRKFVVQPLPVKDFHISRIKKDHYRLAWQPTPDRLEPTAI
ncbi:MAG: xanthan lyase, partial [Muribaculaceae bacterium]|nr:xanthan lyase [Muribaculaceae bacterium]